MNGWEINSQKKEEIWSLLQSALWCLPLPFLMELKVGFDFYILGPAYYLAVIRQKKWRFSAAIFALIGILLLPSAALRWKYGLMLTLWTGMEWGIDLKRPLMPFWRRCFFYEGGLVLSVIILSLTGTLAAYQIVAIFLEAAILMGAACLYHWVISQGAGAESLTNREVALAGASLVMGTMLAAFHWVQLGGLIPAEILLLTLALASGYSLGIAKGMVLSLPAAFFMRLTLTAGEGLVMLALLLTLLAGAFQDMGKKAVVTAGFSGGSLWVIILMGGENVIPGVLTIGSACLAFGIIPQQLTDKMKSRRKAEQAQGSPWQRYIENQLSQGAEAFRQIAGLIRIPPRQLKITSQDLVYLKEDIAGSLCQDCESQRLCWGSQYAKTHETVVRVMEASRQKGRVQRSDLPAEFLKTCQQVSDFVRTVNRHYELYRLNQSWENRMAQSAQMLRGQYESMADYLEEMRCHFAGELSAEQQAKQQILRHFARQGLPIRGAWVMADEKENRIRIHLDFDKALSGRAINRCETMLTELTGRQIVLQEKTSRNENGYRYRFADPNLYRFQLGITGLSRETISGDSYIAQRLDEYRLVLALGDGMGSGREARDESERALALLEQLLRTGIEEEKAIRLLNTALVLSSKEEIFTTIDLALLNLHSGQLKLVKAGSCTTFLRSRAAVHVYHSQSLPVGILEEPEPETFSHQMENGDLLIMISDGVLDQLPDPKRGERWLRRYLMQTEEENPQALAERLQAELTPHLPQVRDDQTILVIRIEKLG